MRHIEPTQEQGARYFGNPPAGPVVMLNLLRFREVADYGDHPELAPDAPISGREAYQRYAAHTLPFLAAAGGELIFEGDAAHHLIGPSDERWDMVLLVRYPSAQVFLSFASNADYRSGLGHRDAALDDSRLLPIASTADGATLAAQVSRATT